MKFDVSLYNEDHALQTRCGTHLLTEKEKLVNLELRDYVVDILPIDDDQKLSDCDLLYRFLVARHWNVKLAGASLREYVVMRKKEGLNNIVAEKYGPDIESIAPVIYGFDREGFPVMWDKLDVQTMVEIAKSGRKEELTRMQLRAMEMLRLLAKARNVERCTLVLDLRNVTLSVINSFTFSFASELFRIFQHYYPEVMCRMLLFNAGTVVTGAWKVLRKFVDQRVQKKVRFVTGTPELKLLLPFIAADQVLLSCGGTGTEDLAAEIIQAKVESLTKCRVTASEMQNSSPTVEVSPPPSSQLLLPPPLSSKKKNRFLFKRLRLRKTGSAAELFSPASELQWYDCRSRGEVEVADTPVSCIPHSFLSGDARLHNLCNSTATSASYASCAKRPQVLQIGSPEALGLLRSSLKKTALCPRPGRHVQIAPVGGQSHVTISLIEGTDGSVIGLSDRVPIGGLKDNVVYGVRSGTRLDPFARRLSFFYLATDSAMVGELLSESGHRFCRRVFVCDGQRRARFVLQKSLLRRCVQVFSFPDTATVLTEGITRRVLRSKRIKIAECVPHKSASDDPSSWVMNVLKDKNDADGVKLPRWRQSFQRIAEKNGQTIKADGVLAEMALVDLFTLLIGICRMWEASLSRSNTSNSLRNQRKAGNVFRMLLSAFNKSPSCKNINRSQLFCACGEKINAQEC